jgi:pimeloyl-ACP methyl ester carboxylesterase
VNPQLYRRALLAALMATALPGCATRSGAMEPHEPGPGAGDWPPGRYRLPTLDRREARARDGTPIHFVVAGRGAPTVVCVHGWACNHRFFAPQLAALAGQHRVLALDLAGHGRSGPRHGPITVEAFADDVEAVVRQEVRGPFVLVVHSTGGRISCAAAKRFDAQLLGIVGIDTFQNLGQDLPPAGMIERRLEAQHRDFVADTRRYVATFFQPGTDPALAAWVERQMLEVEPAAAIAATEAFGRFDGRKAIDGFPRRMVAINSDWVPIDARRIREVVPRFDAVLMPGRGHFPNLEDPDAFNPLLLAELQRIVAGR